MTPADHDVTRILRELSAGDPSASDRLLPLVYEELHRRAEQAMNGQPGQTLQPTALVHEVWIRMAAAVGAEYDSRSHFVSVAAKAMRQVLVDRARKRRAQKRGGEPADRERMAVAQVESDGSMIDVLDLQEALQGLEVAHPRCAQIAELRFFGGLDVREVAAVLGTSERTVYSDWRFARAWLRRAMGTNGPA